MLSILLERGDEVSIDNGKLVIQPKSGKAVPDEFMVQHAHAITLDALTLLGITGYQYMSYSTGVYGEHKSAGISLQFIDLRSGENPYACFNVDLKRKRGGDKGKALPKGQFSVGRRSQFYKLWLSTGLPVPDSLTRFYQCMGKLKDFIFTADITGDQKIKAKTLKPLNITSEQLLSAHNFHINNAQPSHNYHITPAHKEMAAAKESPSLEPDQTACVSNYGNKVIRMYGYKGNDIAPLIDPLQQSTDEWLSDYNSVQ